MQTIWDTKVTVITSALSIGMIEGLNSVRPLIPLATDIMQLLIGTLTIWYLIRKHKHFNPEKS